MRLLCCGGLGDCFYELVDHSPLGASLRRVPGVRLGSLLSILLVLYHVPALYSKIQIQASGLDVYPGSKFWARIFVVLHLIFRSFTDFTDFSYFPLTSQTTNLFLSLASLTSKEFTDLGETLSCEKNIYP